jgi:hypothetical protein
MLASFLPWDMTAANMAYDQYFYAGVGLGDVGPLKLLAEGCHDKSVMCRAWQPDYGGDLDSAAPASRRHSAAIEWAAAIGHTTAELCESGASTLHA